MLIATANVDGLATRREMKQAQIVFSNGKPQGSVMLSVTDSGIGMPAYLVERAFDPFFTTKPIGSGTGLGLSMIYGFVQQSGGQVEIKSIEGQGTTVSIFLPMHEGREIIEIAAEPAASFIRLKATILVVEDEPAVRMVMVEALADRGFTIIEGYDGLSGLRCFDHSTPIDLLITDVGLPGGLNGRQLADAARQLRRGLKVLFVTGYAESVAVGNGLMEAGMEVLVKPFDLEVLVARVQAMLTASGMDPMMSLRPMDALAAAGNGKVEI